MITITAENVTELKHIFVELFATATDVIEVKDTKRIEEEEEKPIKRTRKPKPAEDDEIVKPSGINKKRSDPENEEPEDVEGEKPLKIKKQSEPVEDEEDDSPSIMDKIEEKVQALVEEDRQAEVRHLLNEFEVKRVSHLGKEDHAAFYKKLSKL